MWAATPHFPSLLRTATRIRQNNLLKLDEAASVPPLTAPQVKQFGVSSTDHGGGKRRAVRNELVLAGCTPGAASISGRVYQDRVRCTAARDLADDYLIRSKELNLLACFAKRRGAT
jgi:hypothetical protein